MKLATLLHRVAITPGSWEVGRADYLVCRCNETGAEFESHRFIRAEMASAEIGPVW